MESIVIQQPLLASQTSSARAGTASFWFQSFSLSGRNEKGASEMNIPPISQLDLGNTCLYCKVKGPGGKTPCLWPLTWLQDQGQGMNNPTLTWPQALRNPCHSSTSTQRQLPNSVSYCTVHSKQVHCTCSRNLIELSPLSVSLLSLSHSEMAAMLFFSLLNLLGEVCCMLWLHGIPWLPTAKMPLCEETLTSASLPILDKGLHWSIWLPWLGNTDLYPLEVRNPVYPGILWPQFLSFSVYCQHWKKRTRKQPSGSPGCYILVPGGIATLPPSFDHSQGKWLLPA